MESMRFKKFDSTKKSTFNYWLWHVIAYNYTAIQLHAWKFKYLFHDIEKPFLKLFMKYKDLQKYHRTHNDHHLEYPGQRDWEAMIIDWECGRYTKDSCPLTATEEANRKFENNEMNYRDYCEFVRHARKLGL